MTNDWTRNYRRVRTWGDETGIDGKRHMDYSCFDGQYAGRIRFESSGPTKGLWQWSGAYPKPMRGSPIMPNAGYCQTVAEAAKAVEDYWDAMKERKAQI